MNYLLALFLLLALPLGAQENVMQLDRAHDTVNQQGLSTSLDVLSAQITSATTRLLALKDCHEKGLMFGPRPDGTEGCYSLLPSCTVPWGTDVLEMGESLTAFATATVPYGQTCLSEVRTCDPDTGALSGTYTNASCTVSNGADCTTPWGTAISSSAVITGYAAATVPYGQSCQNEQRTCINGLLSGSYANASCTAASPANCNLPWGGQIAHGGGVMAYAASSVPYGQSCVGEARYCNNSALSGSYGHSSCSVEPCNTMACICSDRGWSPHYPGRVYFCPYNFPGYYCFPGQWGGPVCIDPNGPR